MRILLAGAAGFIGSHLSTRFVADGHEVVGVDDLSTGRRQNLAHLAGEPRFTFLEHDVCAPLALAGELDWVLHFACNASPPKYLARPLETLRVCSEGSSRLLELAAARGAKFLLASTSEVYGDPLVHPQDEAYFGNVNPIGPRSVYDEGKRFAEALTTAHHRARGTPVRIVRIFNTYGPRMDPDDGRVVTAFVSQALRGEPLTMHGDGLQTRSLQYVDDLVEGIVRLMACDHAGPVNLGNPEELTVHDIAKLVAELVGVEARLAHLPAMVDDPRSRRPDIRLARALLGWAPQIGAREGLRRTIAAMRADAAL